jgi:hypothetical protein
MLAVSACVLVKREVQYARATKLPEECKGFMRLVDGKVTVAIISSEGGAGDVSAFDTGEPKEVNTLVNGKKTVVECSAYLVVHEQDVAQFVRNTQRLQALLKNPDIAKLAKDNGL